MLGGSDVLEVYTIFGRKSSLEFAFDVECIQPSSWPSKASKELSNQFFFNFPTPIPTPKPIFL